MTSKIGLGVTAQINPPDWTIPGYSLDYTLGIVWELPDYTPGYTLGAHRVYPTSPDYTPPDGFRVGYSVGDRGMLWDISYMTYNQLSI